ncbi:hypothetical protein [Methylobacterium nigriterrae]
MAVFATAMVSTLGLIALHERPFDGPMPVSAAALQSALSIVAQKPTTESR